jgi:hypothetical protein
MKENDKNIRAISDEDMNEVNGGIFLGGVSSFIGNDLVDRSKAGEKKKATKALLTDEMPKAKKLGEMGAFDNILGGKVVSGGSDINSGMGSGSC